MSTTAKLREIMAKATSGITPEAAAASTAILNALPALLGVVEAAENHRDTRERLLCGEAKMQELATADDRVDAALSALSSALPAHAAGEGGGEPK